MEMIINPDALITKKEVCQILKISAGTLWKIRNEENFPKAILISKRRIAWRYRDVLKYIELRDNRIKDYEFKEYAPLKRNYSMVRKNK